MNYYVKASSLANQNATIHIKDSNIGFGTTSKTEDSLPNPAELFLSAFAACILKNVERFSKMMNFSYAHATLDVNGVRLDNPPRMDSINYVLTIYSRDKKLNKKLLKKNIEKYGTIFNTVSLSSSISGDIIIIQDV